MFEGKNFTSRCFIQFDETRKNLGRISVFFYKGSCDDSASNVAIVPLFDDPRVKFIVHNDEYDDNGDRWIIAELIMFNTTVNDSGCYYCVAANFEHTDSKSSKFVYVQSKFAFKQLAIKMTENLYCIV